MKSPRRRQAMLLTLCLAMGLPGLAANDQELLEKVRQALEARQELLQDYSVIVTTRIRTPGPAGERTTQERQYFGKPGQFRSEALAGGPGRALPGRFGRGGRGPGGRAGGPFRELRGLQQQDLLSALAEDLLESARIEGTHDDLVQIRVKARLEGVKLKDAFLWVEAQTGQPRRLESKFSGNRGFSGGKLTILYAPDSTLGINLAREQELEIELGGPGGSGGRGEFGPARGPGGFAGQPLRLSMSWQDYQWNLEFAENFFQPEAPQPPRAGNAPASAGRNPGRGTPQVASPNQIEDPFEEIRIQPRAAAGTGSESQQTTGPREEVLIEGGAVDQEQDGARNFGESRLMSALMGAGGRGGGGFGGGLRGARIAGSRANGLQGAANATFSGSLLDARPYALDGRETRDPGYLTWQLGASVGGPLGSSGQPGASRGRRGGRGGGRSSFFLDFSTTQGNRLQSQFGTVPTPLERMGDFSQTTFRAGPLAGNPVKIFDPASGQAFAGSLIPNQRLDPAAQQILDFVPLPNRSDPFLNYFQESKLHNQSYRINSRLNLPLSDSLRVNAAYNLSLNQRDQFSLFPDLTGSNDSRGQRLSLRFNHRIGQGLTHNPSVNWNRNRSQNLNPFAFSDDIASQLGFENTSTAPIDFGLPTLEFTNFSDISDGNSRLTINEFNSVADSFNLIWRRHLFRIGGEVDWRRRNLFGNPSGSGVLTFAGSATSQYLEGSPRANTGYDLADFLLGLAQSSRIQYGNSDHYLRRREFSLYLNDNWRAFSNLTIQWGLRYQYTAPWTELQDRIANLDITPGFSEVETVVPGQVGKGFGNYPDSLVRGDRNNLAPRIGLAYRLRSGNYPSVLRSSYGVFFPDEVYNYYVNELISQPPFGFTVQQSIQAPPFLDMETAFAEEFAAEVANSYAVDPNLRLPTVQNWDLSWQQALPKGFFISLGYAGSRGVGLEQLRAPNRTRGGGDLIAGAAEFLYLTSGAGSTFHGLQVLATRRMRGGFSVSTQYEFGKSIDNASSIAGGNRVVAQNDTNLDAERSRSSFDERHKLNLSWFLELPFGNRRHWLRNGGVAGAVLEDWYLNGTLRASSGTPFTARLQGNRINNSGTASQASERADANGLPVELGGSQSTTRWFNTDAFSIPEAGTFGNAGRNTIDGPGSWTIDLNLARAFTVGGEGHRLLLMLRSSNVLNHPNYRGLNTTVNSTGFGRVTSVAAMRSIQLNLRYIF